MIGKVHPRYEAYHYFYFLYLQFGRFIDKTIMKDNG